MVWADSRRITRALRYLGVSMHNVFSLLFTRLSLSLAALSRAIQLNWARLCWRSALSKHDIPLPLKYNTCRLSRTLGLDCSPFAHHYWGNHFVFFSWHYLDVSVHAVRPFTLCVQIKVPWVYQGGFPHSEIFGSTLDWQLPEAYGSLPPPSSPLDAKASTKRPFQLITNFDNSVIYATRTTHYKYFKDR